jgi:hypothetical protein
MMAKVVIILMSVAVLLLIPPLFDLMGITVVIGRQIHQDDK